MSVRETANMIERIIKKAQNNKINEGENSQISREEFENINWENWPGVEFGMPKVISNLIKILTGVNMFEKAKITSRIKLDFSSQ